MNTPTSQTNSMASLRKHKNSKYWYACITGPDKKQRQFSTGLADRADAFAAAVEAEWTLRQFAAEPSKLRAELAKVADKYAPREHQADAVAGRQSVATAGRKEHVK